jgi:hypothetical protein
VRRLLAALAALPLAVVSLSPAAAEAQRMQLDCGDRVVERTNGASWWGVDDDSHYVTAHLRITADGVLVHEQDLGEMAGKEHLRCEADHPVGDGRVHHWSVELVQVR